MPGVYISYPFCDQKCTYCNFVSGVFPLALEQEYLSALRAEIQAHEWGWTPETIYVGGGSPGRMDPSALEHLLEAVPGRPWSEATLEAAPGSVTPEKAAAWRRAGVGRVSLGVQSFVAEEARRTGRKHTAASVAAEVEALRREGLGNFNIDLIAGLPGQTMTSWRESLDWVARLEAPHVSVYMLEVDEDSRLGREILRGGPRYGARDAPPEEEVVSFYETAVEYLARLGILRYEISNFARPGFESRHNLKYWRLEPYAGFGADAHSFDGALRRRNAESPAEYVERCRKGQPARVETAAADRAGERFYVGLRLREGVRPTPEELSRFAEPVRRFLEEGLLEAAGGTLRLTSRGVLFSNEVFQEFLDL